MQILVKTKRFPQFGLMLFISVFLLMRATTTYAAADPTTDGSLPTDTATNDSSLENPQTLSVDEAWLTGDVLNIAVTDKNTGESQTLKLNLSDYAKPGDEYVTVQATDKDGRESNAIQFKNPYYVPQDGGDSGNSGDTSTPKEDTAESVIPEESNPFTPDGTGTVIDNATDGDGKEFFTVETGDGNAFYLIVDRERSTDNVYLLNAVTEDDLKSLAKSSEEDVNAVETPTAPTPAALPETAPEPVPPTTPTPEKGISGNSGTILFIAIAVVVIGGSGYYIKILRPKQLGTSSDPDGYDDPEDDEDFDEDDELEVSDEDEGGEYE